MVTADDPEVGRWKSLLQRAGLALLLVAPLLYLSILWMWPSAHTYAQERKVRRLIAELESATTAQSAMEQLRRMGGDVAPMLAKCVVSGEGGPASQCIEVLKRMGPDAAPAVPILTSALQGKRPHPMQMAVYQLLPGMGPAAEAAIPSVAERLGEFTVSPQSVTPAAETLAAIGPASIPALRTALQSSNGAVPIDAAYALGLIGADAAVAVPDILRLLEAEPHLNYLDSLYMIGPAAQEAIPLVQGLTSHPRPDVRSAACQTLVSIDPGSPETRAIIEKGLLDEDRMVQEACRLSLSILDGKLQRAGPGYGRVLE